MAEGYLEYVPAAMKRVLDAIFEGQFGDLSDMHVMLKELIEGKDTYCLCWDFNSYLACQSRVDECYRKPAEWNYRSILSTARCAKFSTDRTIKDYASKIWYPLVMPKNVGTP